MRPLVRSAALLAGLWPALAWGELTPLAQDRSVSAHADLLSTVYIFGMEIETPSTEDDSSAAAGFEAFDDTAEVTWVTAEQSSRIEPYRIAGSGGHDVSTQFTTTGSPPADGSSTLEGSADAASAFQVEFQLAEESAYGLDAHLEGWTVFGSLSWELTLTGPGSSVVFDIGDHLFADPATACNLGGMSNVCGDASVSGSLAPGTYVLRAETSGGAATFPANPSLWDGSTGGAWSFELRLAPDGPPVPALAPAPRAALALALVAGGLAAARLRPGGRRSP